MKDELMDIIRREEAEGRATRPLAANERQHGGSHYMESSGIQHWDFVHLVGLDYYQGNATKYVSRWRKKNGIEDLEKALHYIDKREELDYSTSVPTLEDKQEIIFQFCRDNRLTHVEYLIIWHICQKNWSDARALLTDLLYDNTPKNVDPTIKVKDPRDPFIRRP